MENHEIQPQLDAISAEIADSTVGFAILSRRDGIEDAIPAGSGTLVTVGLVNGILTASHVLRNLPDKGDVGIVRFPRVPRFAQKQTIDIGRSEKLTIGTPPFGPEGPDLGFLRLSSEDAGNLKARCTFLNLEKKRSSVLDCHQPEPPYFDGISGMIAEWTTDLPSDQGQARVKGFRALFGVGLVVRTYESSDFDLFDFEVTYGPGSVSPLSYEGMSGGGLWRVGCTKGENGRLLVVDKTVFGVAFHQSPLSDQKRIITCHGPKSVYGALIKAIHEKWGG